MPTISSISQLILSGGGILGYSYIGVLKSLEESHILSQINHIIGCSAGSLFGTLIAIGYTSDELYSTLLAINAADYIDVNVDNILLFPITKGLDSNHKFIHKLKELITAKTTIPNLTFSQLYSISGMQLEIGVTNINTMKFELFNHTTSPDVPIYLAVQASIAIPLLFQPVRICDTWYCDGGVSNNFPFDLFHCAGTGANASAATSDTTLGIYLTNEINTDFNIQTISLTEYIDKLLKSSTNIIPLLEKHHSHIAIITIPRSVATSMNFLTPTNNALECIQLGYSHMHSWIITTYPQIS